MDEIVEWRVVRWSEKVGWSPYHIHFSHAHAKHRINNSVESIVAHSTPANQRVSLIWLCEVWISEPRNASSSELIPLWAQHTHWNSHRVMPAVMLAATWGIVTVAISFSTHTHTLRACMARAQHNTMNSIYIIIRLWRVAVTYERAQVRDAANKTQSKKKSYHRKGKRIIGFGYLLLKFKWTLFSISRFFFFFLYIYISFCFCLLLPLILSHFFQFLHIRCRLFAIARCVTSPFLLTFTCVVVFVCLFVLCVMFISSISKWLTHALSQSFSSGREYEFILFFCIFLFASSAVCVICIVICRHHTE